MGLDLLSSRLEQYQRILLPLTARTYSIVANLVMEFRPDALVRCMAFYINVSSG